MNGPAQNAAPIDPAAAAALVASERWLAKTAPGEDGCMLWTAYTCDGYGQVALNRRRLQAHRVAYVAATGADIERGLVIDHLCRTRACVNPDHLRAVTNRENILADGSLSPTALNATKTHCSRCGAELGLPYPLPLPLGMTWSAYTERYGRSRATAEALLAEHESAVAAHLEFEAILAGRSNA